MLSGSRRKRSNRATAPAPCELLQSISFADIAESGQLIVEVGICPTHCDTKGFHKIRVNVIPDNIVDLLKQWHRANPLLLSL